MFEAQLGALRDIDFGIIPYTSSSYTISAYAPIGAGIPSQKIDKAIGIMKAYSSCVGEGPFTCELFGDEAKALRDAGGEYGAATGRPRRVGGFDVPASRYGIMMQDVYKRQTLQSENKFTADYGSVLYFSSYRDVSTGIFYRQNRSLLVYQHFNYHAFLA